MRENTVKNIDEILRVPCIDAVYVGPSDLSLTLGRKPRLDQTDAPVVEAQQKSVEAQQKSVEACNGTVSRPRSTTPPPPTR